MEALTSILIQAAIVVVMIICSAVLSCTETSVSMITRHQLYRQEGKKAKIASLLVNKKDKIVSALLLSNNVVNILVATISTSLFIKILGSGAGVLTSTIVVTLLLFVLGEMAPKVYALHENEKVVKNLGPFILILHKVCGPIINITNKTIVSWLLKMVGIDSKQPPSAGKREDLRTSIEIHAEDGFLVKQERNMLTSICDLDSITVEDIMRHRKDMVTLCALDTLEESVSTIAKTPHSIFPVWRENPDNIVGVVKDKDILSHFKKFPKRGVMSLMRNPWFVPETTTAREQMNLFFEKKEMPGLALVVDEWGGIKGLITLQDIIEEITGQDPRNRTSGELIRKSADGSLLIDGATTLRDINKLMDWNLQKDDANTIAGFVLNQFLSIPNVGQKFAFNNLSFEILGKKKNQITLIRVRQNKQAPEGKANIAKPASAAGAAPANKKQGIAQRERKTPY